MYFIFLLLGIGAAVMAWATFTVISSALAKNTQSIEANLESGFVFVDVGRFLTLYYLAYALIAATLLIAWLNAITIALLIVMAALPHLMIFIFKRKRLEQIEHQLPDALMMISGALRSGASLGIAMKQLVDESPRPIKDELGLVLKEQKLGASVDQSFEGLQSRVPLSSVVLAVTTIRIANETGGELAESLSKTADTLRKIEQAEGKIKALTAQGKMQAWVVGAMPLLLMLVLSRMEPEAMGQLWTTPAGWIALAALTVLEFLGMYTILKIVSIDV